MNCSRLVRFIMLSLQVWFALMFNFVIFGGTRNGNLPFIDMLDGEFWKRFPYSGLRIVSDCANFKHSRPGLFSEKSI